MKRTAEEEKLYNLQNALRKADVALVQEQNRLIEQRNIKEEEARETLEKIQALKS